MKEDALKGRTLKFIPKIRVHMNLAHTTEQLGQRFKAEEIII